MVVSNVLSAGAGAFAANLGLRARVGRIETKVGITETGALTGNGLIGTTKQHAEWLDGLRVAE